MAKNGRKFQAKIRMGKSDQITEEMRLFYAFSAASTFIVERLEFEKEFLKRF